MRRMVVLLALLLAGIAGGRSSEPGVPPGGPATSHGIDAAAHAPAPHGLRAEAPLLTVAWEEPSPGGPDRASRRPPATLDPTPRHAAGVCRAAFAARAAVHLGFATPHALGRAGRLASPSTAPPFRIV